MSRKLLLALCFLEVSLLCNPVFSQVLDPSNLDPGARQFVTIFFPETNIMTATLTDYGYNVTLNDFTSIDFDLSFSPLKIDCNESTTYYRVPDNLVPQQIHDHISDICKKCYIVVLEYKNQVRVATLSNGQKIRFVKNRIIK